MLEESIWDSRTASFKAEIAEQETVLQKYEDELISNGKQIIKLTKSENDLKNEKDALASQIVEVKIESEQLKGQLQTKSGELAAKHTELENLSVQNAQLVKHAELLSQCVSEGKNLESDTHGLSEKIADAIRKRDWGILAELGDGLIALKTFNKSWSYGVCSDAYSIAEQYPLN